MNPTDLACMLPEHDIKLLLRLVVDAPRRAMTEAIQAALVAHKPALIHQLAREAHWAELSRQRWGPALQDDRPGLVVDNPDPARSNYQPCTDPNDPEWTARREDRLPLAP